LVVDEQLPAPLQVPAVVSAPEVQDAALQEVVDAGYEHAVLVPSQREPQAVPAPTPPHAERVPTGAPTT
jgi:hypothetical protein